MSLREFERERERLIQREREGERNEGKLKGEQDSF